MAGRAQSAEELALEKKCFLLNGLGGLEERSGAAVRSGCQSQLGPGGGCWRLEGQRQALRKRTRKLSWRLCPDGTRSKRVVLGRGGESDWEAAGETGRGKRWMVAAQQLRHWKEEGAAEGRGGCQACVISSLTAAYISTEPRRAKPSRETMSR